MVWWEPGKTPFREIGIDMFVVCPSCRDVFRIRSAHLSVAQGRVRCGGCHTLFDATVSLYESRAEAAAAVRRFEAAGRDIGGLVASALARMDSVEAVEDEASPVHREECEPSSPTDNRFIDADLHANPVIGELVSGEPVTLATSAEPAAVLHHAFDDDYLAARGPRGRTWLALAACLLLVAGLAGQYVWKQRYEFAARDAWRPWLERYCRVLGCDLPLRHDVAQLEILEREVRNHPRVKDALLISATFVNEAAFAQAWPILEVTFSDVSGTPIAVRRFTPDDYLSPKSGVARGMAPGEKTRLVLEVVDPGKSAVSYQFDFL